jgi:hypothetical protein
MGDNLVVQAPLDPAACKAELETVLASQSFGRAPAVSKILAFVCNKYLEGAGDTINEWTIAIDGLGRRPIFDPEKDAIVRVEFHLLRKRLAQYYAKEGASHAIRITFAESGYLPRFVPAVSSSPAETEPVAAPPPQVAPPPAVETDPLPKRLDWRRIAIPVGIALLAAVVFFADRSQVTSQPASAAVSRSSEDRPNPAGGVPNADDAIRIAVGLPGSKYVDSCGHSWSGDPYVTGGTPFDRSDRKILRTLNQALYQKGREGEFRYDIPAKRGTYELHLYFAETRFGQDPLQGADAMRRFDVSLNGRSLLEDFDITKDAAGTNTATVKIWKDATPGPDGFLHLLFSARSGLPLLNAIELLPGTPGEPLPIRIICSAHPVYDKQGHFWHADDYFLGGRLGERHGIIQGVDDLSIHASPRFGNFSYAIPVAAGETYRATLRFADANSRKPGERLFDVFMNGVPLLRDFDIVKKAGGPSRAVDATFRGLRPNAQSKLIFSFVPSRDYASLDSLEIEAERK